MIIPGACKNDILTLHHNAGCYGYTLQNTARSSFFSGKPGLDNLEKLVLLNSNF